MDKLGIYVKQFKSVILILALGVLLFAGGLSKVIPIVINIMDISKQYTESVNTLADKKRSLETLKVQSAEETKNANKGQIKEFYKPIEKGMDTETAIASEFSEILTIIRGNQLKTRSIKYEYNPKDDKFVKSAGGQYNVAKLDLEIIGSYKKFESFLKELYKHEHFLDISAIEIVPYNRDKTILIIKFQLKLYAQK